MGILRPLALWVLAFLFCAAPPRAAREETRAVVGMRGAHGFGVDRATVCARWEAERLTDSGWVTIYSGENVLCNEGISQVESLIAGRGGAAFDSTCYMRIGNDDTPALASDTGLWGDTTWYEDIDATYPQVIDSLQQVKWRITIADGDAEFGHREVSLCQDSLDDGMNFNRLVMDSVLVKTSGDVFRYTYTFEMH